MNKNKKIDILNILTYIILSVFAIVQILPFYIQLVHSFQPFTFIPKYGKIEFWPESFNFSNYSEAVKMAKLFEGLKNTLIVSAVYTFLSLIVVFIVGYVLGKKTFKGKKIVTICLIATMMIPGEILMVPNYFLIVKLGMLNKLSGLFLPGIVNIFGIFLVRQYMNTIPNELLECASLDGCSEIGKIFRIVLPNSLPIVGTYSILTFVSLWNDYLWPSIVLRTDDKFTLQIKLMEFNPMFSDQRDQILLSAGLIATLFPIIIIYILFQKNFIKSVSTTGFK